MGAGTAELVATGGARKVAQEIADAPRDEADARLERLQSIARPHRIKEPLSPRRRHLLERNDLPVRGTLLEPPPVATRDLLEDLGLKSDAIRTVRDSSELSPRRSTMRRRPPADWELKASTRSDGDFGATLAEALANAAVDPVLRASDSQAAGVVPLGRRLRCHPGRSAGHGELILHRGSDSKLRVVCAHAFMHRQARP